MILALVTLYASTATAQYRKAVETKKNVLRKKYPKIKKIEVDINGGAILNQAYITSAGVGGTITYFWKESWGLGIEGGIFINSDKSERVCIETFYNDTSTDDVSGATGKVCAGQYEDVESIATEDLNAGNQAVRDRPDGSSETANMGPAYVPIRTKKFYAGLNFTWSPIYGKQLMLLSNTNYFDVFFTFAGGAMFSDFHASKQESEPGKVYRQTRESTGSTTTAGVSPSQSELYGIDGRPDALPEINGYIHLGVGVKYHFLKVMHLQIALKNYTLVGTQETGIDNFVTMWAGLGFRL